MLNTEQNNLFLKYMINYSTSPHRQELIKHQKYLYTKTNDITLEKTAIKDLVYLINDDIKNQYSFKQDIENKTGFLMALWGVLSASAFDTKIIETLICNISAPDVSIFCITTNIILLLVLAFSGLFVLIEIVLVFHTSEYSQVPYNDKTIYHRIAVDDQNMFWVRMLEVTTNVWEKNNNTNDEKFKHFIRAVYSTGIFALFYIICNCI